MKIPPVPIIAALSVLAVSCDRDRGSVAHVPAAPASYSTPGKAWEEPQFTVWMSRAELQFMQEGNPADRYFARVEGRNNGGRMEYRAVVQPFPSDEYEQWAVFWGISETELFDWELRLLKAGFTRDNMQVCGSPDGKTFHQIVWLKPLKKVAAGEPVPAVTTEDVIAGQSLPDDSAGQPTPPPATAEEDATPPKAVAVPQGGRLVHTVRPGDTLGRIARTRGVPVAEIRRMNGLKNDVIRIGQRLEIPEK